MRVGQERNETPETLTGSDTTDAPEESDTYLSDQAAVKELALDEFEWGNGISHDVLLAIPVKTVTGRVYKSFEGNVERPHLSYDPHEQNLGGGCKYAG